MANTPARSVRVPDADWDAAMNRAASEGLELGPIIAAFVARYGSGRDRLDAVPGYPVLRADIDQGTVTVVREIWSKPPGERYASHLTDQTIAEWSLAEALGFCASLLGNLAAANTLDPE